jgi:hypothetical protein
MLIHCALEVGRSVTAGSLPLLHLENPAPNLFGIDVTEPPFRSIFYYQLSASAA